MVATYSRALALFLSERLEPPMLVGAGWKSPVFANGHQNYHTCPQLPSYNVALYAIPQRGTILY
jgi:hypothetical protein